jgi:hypothetical protein
VVSAEGSAGDVTAASAGPEGSPLDLLRVVRRVHRRHQCRRA